MTKPLRLVAIPLVLFAVPALSCEYPARIEVPDGRTATEDTMLQGQQAVKGYISAMEEYLDCIDKESEGLGNDDDDDEKERRAILVSKHNAAVDEMETVADAFNEQVRAWKEAKK